MKKQGRRIGLVVAGVLLILIGLSMAFVSTAEWELPFYPSDPDPKNPPPGGGSTGTPTTTYTWTTKPPTEFYPKASVKVMGVDGSVLKQFRLFAVWEFGDSKVAYIEVPFYVGLGGLTTVTDGETVTISVPEQRVQVVLYIKIKHENISNIVIDALVDAAVKALTGSDASDVKPRLLTYEVVGVDEVMVVFMKEKVVTLDWAGSFYFVPDTLFEDVYSVLGEDAYGAYEFSFAMKVILPDESLSMASSWVTITLRAEPNPDSGGGDGGGGGGNPPGGKSPIKPISVVWEP